MRFGLICFVLFMGSVVRAGTTLLKWHGHAAFEITTPKGKSIFIDPWLSNPLNPQKDPLAKITRADYILITHGHSDHVGDSVILAKKTKAILVSNFELANALVEELGFPKDQTGMETTMNIGGKITLGGGEVQVTMVPAVHSSGLQTKSGLVYGGSAAGFVIAIKEGPTIYHSGDTALFRDMELIGKNNRPDVALLNIGGHFGMEPEQAVEAAALIHPKLVIPHHFKTFPILTPSAEPFLHGLKARKIAGREMKPGETLRFEGSRLQN